MTNTNPAGLSHASEPWPQLEFTDWKDTCETLHLWTQIVGKIRLVQTPWLNHSWHVPLYLTARGLTTSPIPYGTRMFEMDFDFIDHQLHVQTHDGITRTIGLRPMAVADFYQELLTTMSDIGLDVTINTTPSELVDPIPFDQDREHASYDAEYANRFWRILLQTDRVFKLFRSEFLGKSSPVHFFWGSFDLAVTRFSGRPAPEHPGGVPNLPDWVAREAYSHEVSSCGLWPGNEQFPHLIFYAYAYPTPDGFSTAAVKPDSAYYSNEMGEFVLHYSEMRQTESPDDTLMAFLQSTYEAAAKLSNWDQDALERGK
ncbi:MAG: DUF5996 family protein [Chloroflexota bacterium]